MIMLSGHRWKQQNLSPPSNLTQIKVFTSNPTKPLLTNPKLIKRFNITHDIPARDTCTRVNV